MSSRWRRINASGATVSQVTSYAYDHLHRLTGMTNPDGLTVSYKYDLQGNRQTVTDPDGRVTKYEYDARNRLHTAVTDFGTIAAATTRYEYYANDLLQLIVYPNGTVADYGYADSYDSANRLRHHVNRHSAPGVFPTLEVGGVTATPALLVSSYRYDYDANGNRVSQQEQRPGFNAGSEEITTYAYDRQHRLTFVAYGAVGQIAYSYDLIGNRLTEIGVDPSESTPVNRGYAYDRLNHLIAITDVLHTNESEAYDYDENGNRTVRIVGQINVSDGSNGNPTVNVQSPAAFTPYEYNVRDELVRTIDGQGGDVTFGYTAGLRDTKITSSGTTRYLRDDAATFVEYDAAGRTLRKYDYGYELLSMTEVDPATQARSGRSSTCTMD